MKKFKIKIKNPIVRKLTHMSLYVMAVVVSILLLLVCKLILDIRYEQKAEQRVGLTEMTKGVYFAFQPGAAGHCSLILITEEQASLAGHISNVSGIRQVYTEVYSHYYCIPVNTGEMLEGKRQYGHNLDYFNSQGDIVDEYSERYTKIVKISSSEEDAVKALEYIKMYQESYYAIVGNNCVTYAIDILNHVGIYTPSYLEVGLTPIGLWRHFDEKINSNYKVVL